jgi:phosphoserine phosphatase
MTENTAQPDQFTGLILLTGTDKPGIASSLFETLAPFAVHIIDIEQLVINDRLILTVLIGANPAHQAAIEEDLNACAMASGVDIATLFSKGQLSPIRHNLVEVHLKATKLHPQAVALITTALTNTGANIERILRTSIETLTITLMISGTSKSEVESALGSLTFDESANISVSVI